MSAVPEHSDPWHTLTVTGSHYHNDPNCPGHTWPDQDTCPDELEYEVEHLATCGPEEGAKEWPFRCLTDYEIEDVGVADWPEVSGIYRCYAWSSGPDYWGEYDAGFEWEMTAVLHGPAPAHTCKTPPWPTPIPRGPVSFTLAKIED